jgi:ribosomal protein S21
MKTIHVQVSKNREEPSQNMLRRFTKLVQQSGLIPRVRSKRYNDRPESALVEKRGALKRIAKTKDILRLKKLGKM